MKIKFIGTGSGKTSLKRFHSSFLILSNDFNLLVDAGDGISRALLKQNISPGQIDGILFSHLHPDHFSGIGALLVQMKLMKREKPLKIFSHDSLIPVVKDFIFSSYLFEERMDFEIKYCGFNSEEETIINDDIKFIAKQNSHLDKYVEYDKEKILSFSCSSFLFSLNNKIVCYTGDVGKKEDLNLFKGQNISILISESTHIHKEAFPEIYEELKPAKLIMTHIPDEEEEGLLAWKSSLSDEIRDNFIIASDGMTISIQE
ncbi:MAG: MBL fold metallo-hydrolase [Ignavibacteriaceae bacterium]